MRLLFILARTRVGGGSGGWGPEWRQAECFPCRHLKIKPTTTPLCSPSPGIPECLENLKFQDMEKRLFEKKKKRIQATWLFFFKISWAPMHQIPGWWAILGAGGGHFPVSRCQWLKRIRVSLPPATTGYFLSRVHLRALSHFCIHAVMWVVFSCPF